MSQSIVVRPIGPTFALSVANTKHADVGITFTASDYSSYAEFTNVGATDICVVISPAGIATPALAFPVDGTPTVPNSFILPHGMVIGKIVAVPTNGFNVSAIGSGAGPSIMYVTPVGNQS